MQTRPGAGYVRAAMGHQCPRRACEAPYATAAPIHQTPKRQALSGPSKGPGDAILGLDPVPVRDDHPPRGS